MIFYEAALVYTLFPAIAQREILFDVITHTETLTKVDHNIFST